MLILKQLFKIMEDVKMVCRRENGNRFYWKWDFGDLNVKEGLGIENLNFSKICFESIHASMDCESGPREGGHAKWGHTRGPWVQLELLCWCQWCLQLSSMISSLGSISILTAKHSRTIDQTSNPDLAWKWTLRRNSLPVRFIALSKGLIFFLIQLL